MELRMFGRSGVPDEDFTKDLKILFGLESAALTELEHWILTSQSLDERDESSLAAIAASSLLPEEFFASVDALRFILEAWQIHRLELLDIQADLFSLGYDAGKIDSLGAMLRRLEPAKKRVYDKYIRSEHENAVLPTLEDIDVDCDIRAIFEDYVSPAPAKVTGVDYKTLIGFSYMVLVELLTEDGEGKTHKLAFQMTEKSLSDLRSALQRASEQLDILKEKHRGSPIQNQ